MLKFSFLFYIAVKNLVLHKLYQLEKKNSNKNCKERLLCHRTAKFDFSKVQTKRILLILQSRIQFSNSK